MDSNSGEPRIPRGRIISFLIIFPGILLGCNAFVCLTWNWFSMTTGSRAWQIILYALTLAFPAMTILGLRFSNFWLRQAYRISAVWLGFLNYAFFAAIAAWVLAGVVALFSLHVDHKVIGVACFGFGIVVSLYGFANASTLRVTSVTVNLPNLPAAWNGRTVAVATDLHLGNIRGPGFARRVVARLEQLHCQAVFICGDMFDGPKADYDALVAPWKKICATTGVYFVTGNHEEFTDHTVYIQAIERAGIRVLKNEKVEMDGLQIVGVLDGELHDPQAFRGILRRAGLDRKRASILLAHQPMNLAIPAEEGISLQASGHTHGGQFWPWIHIAARVHGPFNRGLNRYRDMQVYTSNGIGTWGAPMRVGTKSEIILITLEPADQTAI